MALNADVLLDRIRLKGQVTRWRIMAIVAAAIAVIIYTQKELDINAGISHIARLNVEDIITDDPRRSEALGDVRDNDNIKAVIVRINSPGGTVVGGVQLYKDLRSIAEKKPVVTVMRNLATSAGYMVAMSADHIIANPGTITGSIGVILQTVEMTELADKIGVEPIIIKSGELKGNPSPLEKITPKARESLKNTVMDFHSLFVDMVADARDLPRDKVLDIADGRVYTGRQALEIQLVDEIGGEKEALQWLEKEKNIDTSLKIKDIKVQKAVPEWLEQASSFFDLGSPMTRLFSQEGLISVWQP